MMEVALLRGRDGKVIFMECQSKFVDALLATMQAPLGAVVGAIVPKEESQGSDQSVPGGGFRASIASLREELFVSSKAEALSDPMDLEILSGGHPNAKTAKGAPELCMLKANQVTNTRVGKLLQLTSTGSAWTTNAVLNVGDRHDFEISMKMSAGQPWVYIMFGIAPRSVNVTSQIYNNTGFYMQVHPNHQQCTLFGQQHTSNAAISIVAIHGQCLKMKLTDGATKPVLQYAVGDGPFVTAHSAIPANETYCPVVCFHSVNTSVTIEDVGLPMNTFHLQKVMEPTVKFLVSNRLEVLENSSVTAIELIARRNGESLVGLRSESVQVTPSAWRRLIAGMLLGRDDILDYAFPRIASPAAAADHGALDAGSVAEDSETSFQLTFPSDERTG